MPLNRIRAPDVRYPAGPDVVPLLKKLNYAQPFHGAFAQVKHAHINRLCCVSYVLRIDESVVQ